jgi:asparagine synthetase B (glutamine-hydrolysing)
MTIKLPKFIFEFDSENCSLAFTSENIFPAPFIRENASFQIIILGNPILNEKINHESIARYFLLNGADNNKFIESINGEYLIIFLEKKKNNLFLINDRFTSIPVYYYISKNKLIGAHKYSDLIPIASRDSRFKLQKNNFFEFLWFRRIHNDTTYDNLIRYLKASRILTFGSNGLDIFTYWAPSFKKNNSLSLTDSATMLSNEIISSIDRKIDRSKDQTINLFLSGGMDTRTLLAAFIESNIENPACYTLGFSEEGEYKTSKLLTEMSNSEHHFIQLPQDSYDLFWEEKRKLSGGFHHQLMNIFIGLENNFDSSKDIFFHGHGFDYLFQGMYLPVDPITIGGKPTHFKRITNLNNIDNFSSYYCNNVPYRTWRLDVSSYLNKEHKDMMMEDLYLKIKDIEIEGQNYANNNYDLWEYMMIHTISRHYSQTDVMGMGIYGEQRKVANDNKILDLYLSLPIEHRLYARILRAALRKMSPDFSKTVSANTGYKIDASPMELTTYFGVKKIMRTITGNKKYSGPLAKDRTWPDDDEQVRVRKRLNKRVMNLHNSEYLRDAMPYFNFEKLKNDSDDWLNNKPGGGHFLICLFSIEEFLRSL